MTLECSGPPSMSLRVRIMSLVGFFLALLLGIGTWGGWSTKRMQDRVLERQGEDDRSLVVGVTAHTDAEAHEKCREAGMDVCVSKPLKLEYLCIVIEEEPARRGAGA